MTDERWRQIADLYLAAQDRSPDERSSFIRKAAADSDSDVRRDVESLLAEDGQSVVVDEPIHAAVQVLFADSTQRSSAG